MQNDRVRSSATDVPLLLTPDFLDPDLCTRVRGAMDRGESDSAAIIGTAIVRDEGVRRTRSIEIDLPTLAMVEQCLDRLRPSIERAFGVPLGQREGTGFLRYEPGGFYLTHRDRGVVEGWPAAASRSVAIVVFLNSVRDTSGRGDFDGGSLCLYPESRDAVEIRPRAGLLAAFPADVLHEVLPVRNGVRDTAVDWFYDSTEP